MMLLLTLVGSPLCLAKAQTGLRVSLGRLMIAFCLMLLSPQPRQRTQSGGGAIFAIARHIDGCPGAEVSNLGDLRLKCMTTDAGVTVHYTPAASRTSDDSGKAYFGVAQDGTGWTSLAFPSEPGQMVGAEAVIHTPGAATPVQVYSMTSKSASGVSVSDSLGIDDVEVLPDSNTFVFSISISTDFPADGPLDILLARSETSTYLSYHDTNRAGLVLDLAGAAIPIHAPTPAPQPAAPDAEAPARDATVSAPEKQVEAPEWDVEAPVLLELEPPAQEAEAPAPETVVNPPAMAPEASWRGEVTNDVAVECTPSDLGDDRLQCMRTDAGVTVHYSVGNTDKAYFAVLHDGTGWCSLAFAGTPGKMVGSTAVIYIPGSSPSVQLYDMTAKSLAGVAVSNAFPIDDVATLDGVTGFVFSRAQDADFDVTGQVEVLVARSDTTVELSYHSDRTGFALDLTAGEGEATFPAPIPQAEEESEPPVVDKVEPPAADAPEVAEDPAPEEDETPTEAATCTPSDLDDDRLQCMRTEASVTVHYSVGNTDKAYFGVLHDGTGWCSLAFADTPGKMVGATAVIYVPGSDPPVQVYDMTATSLAGVEVSNAFPIDDVATLDGVTGFVFSRASDADFDVTGTVDVLVARSERPVELSYHSDRTGFALDFAAVAGDVVEAGPTPEEGEEEEAPEEEEGQAPAEESTGLQTVCTPSDLGDDRFQCMRTEAGVNLHYSVEDTNKTFFAVQHDGTGWCSIAFASSPGQMVGATAVIYAPGSDPPVQVYDMTSKSLDGLAVSNAFTIDDVATLEDGTGFVFSRVQDGGFDVAGNVEVLLARSESDQELSYHSERTGFLLDLAGGEGGAATSAGPTQTQRDIHGVLMTLGWGILIPLGVILAASLRWKTPLWFKLHQALQMVGLTLALGGFVLAVTQFDTQAGFDTSAGKHAIAGIAVMAVGILQPLNAFLRPHAPKAGEPKPCARSAWEWSHKGLGYLCAVLAIVNVFLGMDINMELGGHSRWYIYGYAGILAALAVLYVGLVYVGRIKKALARTEVNSENKSVAIC